MKAVCIVGLASQNMELAYHQPKNTELWCLNQGHTVIPEEYLCKFTRWFQIHSWEAMSARQNPQSKHIEWLSKCDIPVYLEQEQPDIPTGIRYPYEAVCQTLQGNYFATNSFGYMIALAIHERFDLIKLAGVTLDYTDKGDGYARPCIEFLLGVAQGKGIKVEVPEDSQLLKGDLYGRSIPVPSQLVEMALDALRQNSQALPYIAQRTSLLQSLHDIETLYVECMRNQARQYSTWVTTNEHSDLSVLSGWGIGGNHQ